MEPGQLSVTSRRTLSGEAPQPRTQGAAAADQTRGPIAERLLAELHRDGSVEFGDLRFSTAGVTAEAGTMPWQRGWKVTRRFSRKGILLQIETAEYGLRTYVPEETVARDLLATLVATYAR